jgi:C-terminal processing protease CtpA/Prc
MDKSGLIIFAAGRELNEFVIQSVIEDSPAAEADIRPGDVITRIQGFPSRFYTLDHISHILQKKNGKKIRLAVKRGDVEIKKRFRLRELI